MMREPKEFKTLEDLPEWMQDRQESHEAQRLLAWRVAREANELSQVVASEFVSFTNDHKPMRFSWRQIEALVGAFRQLCEYTQAVNLIEKELRELHDAGSDDKPF